MHTIDLTPTWSGLLPALLALLSDATTPVETRRIIEAELARMARAADAWNAHAKSLKGEAHDED
jgi:hypothetical protein